MTTTRSPDRAETPLTRELLYAARYYLGNRRVLLVLAGLALAAGLALNWNWLAAAGLAPIILAALPCLAMCVLGFCMNRASGKSCSTGASAQDLAATETDDAVPTVHTATVEAPPNSPMRQAPSNTLAAPLTNPELQPLKERSTTDA